MNAFIAAANTTSAGDLTTYEQAMHTTESHFWQWAMTKEITSLQNNSTWVLVDLPPGQKTFINWWVYTTRPDVLGKDPYKAWLVTKGFTQEAGVDYEETFAPVAQLDSLRLLLSLAAVYDWEIHQIDIKSAYLNGVLEEEIYMDQPTGFEVPGSKGKVCHLLKAIYGLKQAGCQWHEHLQGTLSNFRYTKLISSNVSIFVKHHDEGDQVTIIVRYRISYC